MRASAAPAIASISFLRSKNSRGKTETETEGKETKASPLLAFSCFVSMAYIRSTNRLFAAAVSASASAPRGLAHGPADFGALHGSRASRSRSMSSGYGWWSSVEPAPRDPILGVTSAFLADTNPAKINVGVVRLSLPLCLLTTFFTTVNARCFSACFVSLSLQYPSFSARYTNFSVLANFDCKSLYDLCHMMLY